MENLNIVFNDFLVFFVVVSIDVVIIGSVDLLVFGLSVFFIVGVGIIEIFLLDGVYYSDEFE